MLLFVSHSFVYRPRLEHSTHSPVTACERDYGDSRQEHSSGKMFNKLQAVNYGKKHKCT